MADEAKELFEQHGLDPESTLAWAKEKAARLLEESGGGDLEGLLEGLDAQPPPRRERPPRREQSASDADEPSVARPLPPLPNEAAAEAEAEDAEELEELDVDELEELDVDELELIEEVDEDEADYSDAPVRTGDTAPHAVVSEAIVDEDEDEDDDDIDLTGMGDDVDADLLGDDSIPIDLDDD
jgi:hypothetical protein